MSHTNKPCLKAVDFERETIRQLLTCIEDTKYATLRLSSLKCLKNVLSYFQKNGKLSIESKTILQNLKKGLPKDLDSENQSVVEEIEKMLRQ